MPKMPTVPALLFLLSACGARQASPVAEVSPLDDRLTCAHLAGELEANGARGGELEGEGQRRARDNVGLLLMGPVAAITFLDTGQTQQTETIALSRRNDRLRGLMRERGCSASS